MRFAAAAEARAPSLLDVRLEFFVPELARSLLGFLLRMPTGVICDTVPVGEVHHAVAPLLPVKSV